MRKSLFIFFTFLVIFSVDAQTIKKTYNFNNFNFRDVGDYTQIELDNSLQSALVGQPSLPWYSVSLLLPQNTEAEDIEVICSDYEEIPINRELFPYQSPRTYSDTREVKFRKDETIYNSKLEYPAVNHGVLTTSYMNGYAIANTTFTPVKYIPSDNKLFMARNVVVKIKLKSVKTHDDRMISSRPEVINRLKSLVHNPEMIHSYNADKAKAVDGYELLVITSKEYLQDFEDYCNFYNQRDIRTNVVDLEYIYSAMEGADNQEKIRNCIKAEYQENDIMMVLLGGDVAIVPYRGFFAEVNNGGEIITETDIPADLYFAALDGTWNDNDNELWGEIGEDDLYPEIGVARMPFNSHEELENMVNKSLLYQQNPVLRDDEFRTVLMVGEFLLEDPLSYGSDYLEMIIGNHDEHGYYTEGIPENYNFKKLYEKEYEWSKYALVKNINEGAGFIYHEGHAYEDAVAKLVTHEVTDELFSDVDGKTHNYTFFHTAGCDCGNFSEDCILEKMVTISNYAVATIGNSKSGWFNEGQTDGPFCHLRREFVDAFWAERIPYLGLAMSEAKTQTASWVNAPGQWEEGALRWNYYTLNVLGDVAVKPWHENPFIPDVEYDRALIEGATSIKVKVSHNNKPLKNFRCSVYSSDVLIGYALTDENGIAEIELTQAASIDGSMKLKVNGMNSYTMSLPIECITNNEPSVFIDKLIVNDSLGNNNGIIECGETIFIDAVVKNFGAVAASGLNASLSSCNTEYFRIIDNWEEFEIIEASSEIVLHNAFEIVIDDVAPSNHTISTNLTVDDYYHFWYSYIDMTIHAPSLLYMSFDYDDSMSNNNGVVEKGETIIMNIRIRNISDVEAENVEVIIDCDNEVLVFDDNAKTIESIAPSSEAEVDFVFEVGDDIVSGDMTQLLIKSVVYKSVFETEVELNIGRMVEDFETGDFSVFDWELDGDANWFITTEDVYSGTYCAHSGLIGQGESSDIQLCIELDKSDTISFYCKTSIENSSAILAFTIDGGSQLVSMQSSDWARYSFPVSNGKHTIKWQYLTNPASPASDSYALIDEIVLPYKSIIHTALNEKKSEVNYDLYPNPNNGTFYIDLGDDYYDVKIFNSLGQLVAEHNGLYGKVLLNNNLKSGLYFVRINAGNNTYVKKMVIR
ncbi:MAG: T9SS type A sorting domain-containing protein [Bacteroidales bacterium]|nr:T9SS type A sorting domain-containing protein [Bacteroidales bacterium]